MSFFNPPTKPLPQGYPLTALDANGTALASGMLVRILIIPDWLTHDLPPDDVRRLRATEGTVMSILELDAYGMVWFGDGAPWFSLKPSEVAAVKPSG
jgi:hypothetical protein